MTKSMVKSKLQEKQEIMRAIEEKKFHGNSKFVLESMNDSINGLSVFTDEIKKYFGMRVPPSNAGTRLGEDAERNGLKGRKAPSREVNWSSIHENGSGKDYKVNTIREEVVRRPKKALNIQLNTS